MALMAFESNPYFMAKLDLAGEDLGIEVSEGLVEQILSSEYAIVYPSIPNGWNSVKKQRLGKFARTTLHSLKPGEGWLIDSLEHPGLSLKFEGSKKGNGKVWLKTAYVNQRVVGVDHPAFPAMVARKLVWVEKSMDALAQAEHQGIGVAQKQEQLSKAKYEADLYWGKAAAAGKKDAVKAAWAIARARQEEAWAKGIGPKKFMK